MTTRRAAGAALSGLVREGWYNGVVADRRQRSTAVLVRARADLEIADALLDQRAIAGVGNCAETASGAYARATPQ